MPDHRVIERGAERVDVRPRPLLARGGGVLLVGAVARLDERAHGLGMRGDLAARRAEVDQDRRPVLADDDVVGGDVAVQIVAGVHHLQRVEQGLEDLVELGLPRRALEALQPGLEAAPLLEVEHHVAGVVGPEVAVDAHDVGVDEAGERLRLLDEALEAPLVVLGAVLRARRGIAGGAARGEVGREVFLDGDEPGQRHLVGQVGDAEAAGPQHALDAVVADQLRPVRQRQQVGIGRRAWVASPFPSRPIGYEHKGEHCPATVVGLLRAVTASGLRPPPRAELPQGAGNNVAERWGRPTQLLRVVRRFNRGGHVPAVMLRQASAQRVGNAASTNFGRAARDRPLGGTVPCCCGVGRGRAGAAAAAERQDARSRPGAAQRR